VSVAAAAPDAAPTQQRRHGHLRQVDLIRIVPMIGVVATHALIFTQPVQSTGSNAVLMLLHANREIFFFVTAFVLYLSVARRSEPEPIVRFWRRRYPLIVVPYLIWTLIYWLQSEGWVPWPPGPALNLLGVDLALGWFHLYFLLVTMQLYAVFPLLVWLVRRTRGHHWWLLGISTAVQLVFTAQFQYGSAWAPWWLQTWFNYAQVELTSYQLYFVLGALAADHLDECLAWIRRHPRAALATVVASAVGAEAWYVLNLAIGERPDIASGVFQPASLLTVVASVLGLALLADRLALTHPADGRVWRTVRAGAQTSFGVYLGHMLPLQLLLLTPLVTLLGLHALPMAVQAAIVLGLVLAATFAMVRLFQRTPLAVALTGRDGGRPQRRRRAAPATAAQGAAPASGR